MEVIIQRCYYCNNILDFTLCTAYDDHVCDVEDNKGNIVSAHWACALHEMKFSSELATKRRRILST